MENPFQFTYIAVILWIGVYQGLILGPVFWFKKDGNQMANRILSAFMLVASSRLLFSIYNFSQQSNYPNFFILFSFPVGFLYGPLYFLYLKSYIEKEFRLQGKQYLHFLPFFLSLIFSSVALFVIDASEINLYQMARGRQLPPPSYLMPLMIIIQTVVYIFLGLRLILKYRKFIRLEASFSGERHIRWLVSLDLLLSLPAFSVVVLLFAGAPKADGSFLPFPAIGLSLMLISMGLIALTRPDFLQGLPDTLRVDKEEDLNPVPYTTSSLREGNRDRYHQQLLDYMLEQEAYLEQELTLTELSSRMGINTKYLSQVINEVEQKSFIDFINSLRIERAKKLLLHPAYQYYTIVAIANEVGFKSKSAFYNAFKKFTKMTPSAYKSLNIKASN